jgi:hypothetical protein
VACSVGGDGGKTRFELPSRPSPKGDDLYRANLTNAYTKKNIQTTSSINMAPINNGGHTRWKIFATALRTTVKSDWRLPN